MSSVRKSLALSMLDSYLGLVLQLAATVIISRLLTPAEVGVFAIAAVFAALASTFRDFGVAEYLIQEADLTREKIRAALAMNILISWSVSLVLFALSSPAASFYDEPGVAAVMRVQAVNFILVPFGAVTQAWFRRQLDYRPIVICNLWSSLAAFFVSVGLALNGFGYMSLAWSSLAGIVVVVAATAWYRPRGFPLWPGVRGISEVFHFGKFASLIYIAAQLGKGAPELIIGRARGAADVGMFSRANGLIEIFHRILLRPVLLVCLPYFADQNRSKGDIGRAYASSVALLTAAGWPFLAVMATLSLSAIRIVYGDQWVDAVSLAQILCLACATELLYLPSREALLASGDARRASLLQMQILTMQVLGLLSVFPFGLAGAAWGLVFASAAGVLLSQWHLRDVGVDSRALARACLPSLALMAITAGPLVIVATIWPLDGSNYVRWGIVGGAASVALWLVGLASLNHALWRELRALVDRFRTRWQDRTGDQTAK